MLASRAPRYCPEMQRRDKGANYTRLKELAVPRLLPDGYFLNRRSVYWTDTVPQQSTGHTEFVPSARLDALSQPKSVAYLKYAPDRDEPIWPVTNAARFHDISERSNTLSEPKSLPASFQLRRVLSNQPGEGRVSESAKFGKTTPRLLTLSAPLDRKRYMMQNEFMISDSGVTSAAKKVEPTEHTVTLATPKNLANGFEHLREVQRLVSQESKRAVASARVQQLARPKSARLQADDYEPYKVSNNAKKAIASTRVCELSEPIPRKVKTKK